MVRLTGDGDAGPDGTHLVRSVGLLWWLLHKIGFHSATPTVATVYGPCKWHPTVGGSGATPRNSAHAPGLTSQWHWYGYAGNLYVPLGW